MRPFSCRAASAPPSPLWSSGRLLDSAQFSQAPSTGAARGSFASSSVVPNAGHLAGTRVWVTLWAAVIGLATAIVLHALSPGSLQSHLTTLDQLLIAIGVSFLLADIYLVFRAERPLHPPSQKLHHRSTARYRSLCRTLSSPCSDPRPQRDLDRSQSLAPAQNSPLPCCGTRPVAQEPTPDLCGNPRWTHRPMKLTSSHSGLV